LKEKTRCARVKKEGMVFCTSTPVLFVESAENKKAKIFLLKDY